MNKLLNPISWTAYLETLTVLAIAYYAFIGWRYYRAEISAVIGRLSGEAYEEPGLPEALQFQAAEPELPATAQAATIATEALHEPALPAGLSGEAAELAEQLSGRIDQASEQPYNPALLISQLKKILNDYPEVAASPDRERINTLIVRECERTGTALLSESETDQWWSA